MTAPSVMPGVASLIDQESGPKYDSGLRDQLADL